MGCCLPLPFLGAAGIAGASVLLAWARPWLLGLSICFRAGVLPSLSWSVLPNASKQDGDHHAQSGDYHCGGSSSLSSGYSQLLADI